MQRKSSRREFMAASHPSSLAPATAASAAAGPRAAGPDQEKDEDTFRILIATDTHVGYIEKDKVRGNDSLTSFEEVLQIAEDKKADFILHGGDLFHDNKPSRACLYSTMDLLRRYLLGPGDIGFDVVSDQTMFKRGMVNYEDVNVNVQTPMFMIHGNHDDPGGESNLSAANLLEVASLVNYFGRSEDLEDIVVKPVLMRKGRSQIALYGLGNIRDERLHRAFQNRKVRFETPAKPEEWFNIMILHQNRHKGNKGGVPNKACIHEQMLPTFLDLVIWGHEHDCEVNPRESLRGEFYVIQPGSSVATSMSQGESFQKHVAVVDVKLGVFRCTPVPLWTVRPLLMKDISLGESGLLRTDTQGIWNALAAEVESLIAEGSQECKRRQQELSCRGDTSLKAPTLPLVRLRVEHAGFEAISTQAFGQQFSDRVANPDELLLFHRRGGSGGTAGSRKITVADNLEIEESTAVGDDGIKIQDIIYKYIDGEQGLSILPEPDLNDAVQSFVHRAEPCAIEKFVRDAVEATNSVVLRESRAVDEEEIRVQIQDRAETLRRQRLAGTGAPDSLHPGGRSDAGGLGGGAAGMTGVGAGTAAATSPPASAMKQEPLPPGASEELFSGGGFSGLGGPGGSSASGARGARGGGGARGGADGAGIGLVLDSQHERRLPEAFDEEAAKGHSLPDRDLRKWPIAGQTRPDLALHWYTTDAFHFLHETVRGGRVGGGDVVDVAGRKLNLKGEKILRPL
nr:double-strand break repair protein MRE11 [Crypthecodinium cohnii]